MLYEEAKWIGKELLSRSKNGNKILNIGSSTKYSRTISQPHMEKYIFGPLRKKKIKVTHTDIIEDEGVDIVGDLTNNLFIEKLKKQKYDFILCSNLLEHLEKKDLIVSAIEEILPLGGNVIITVPYSYPYHLDPIDTMYRPNITDLKTLFRNLSFHSGRIIQGRSYRNNNFQTNYFQQLVPQPNLFLRLFLRLFFPFYKFKIWKFTFKSLLNMFNNFSVTCVLLKKEKK